MRSPTSRANSTISRGSERSRRCARCDITRCWSTRNTTRSISSGVEAHALEARARAHRALRRVVAAEPLADVVEQAAEVDGGEIGHVADQLGQRRQLLLVVALEEPPQLLDQEDRVHVDRVGVIHDVLPAADDVLPLRQEARQQAHLVHRDQRARDAVRRAQDAQEGLDRLRLASGSRRRSGRGSRAPGAAPCA